MTSCVRSRSRHGRFDGGLRLRRSLTFALFALISCAPSALAFDVGGSSGQCIDRWSQAEGLSQNFIRAILQTRDGYLWVGTKGGLSRFDGHNFTTFGGFQGLQDEIWALLEDDDGSVWIGAYGSGLCHLKQGEVRCLTPRDGLAGELVTALAKGPDGSLWIAADGGGLSRLKDGKLVTLSTKDGLLDDHVRSLRFDRAGRLWIGTMRGLNILDRGRIESRADRLPKVLDQHVSGIDVADDGTIWIAVFGGGVVRWRGGEWTHFTAKDGLVDRMALSIHVDRNGVVWVGTNSGLSRFVRGRFESISQSGPDTLPDYVNWVTEDREGGLWLGTATAGIARLRNCAFTSLTAQDGLANNEVHAIVQDGQATWWIGTVGGLTRLRDGAATTYTPRDGLRHESIRSLLADRHGRLWIGTQDGLNVMQDGRISAVARAGLDHKDIRTLWVADDDSLWVGTDGSGIYHLRKDGVARIGAAEGLHGRELRAMVGDRRGRIWIGLRDGGLGCIEGEKLRDYTPADGFTGHSVMGLYVDTDDALWVMTRHGLVRLKNDRFTTLTARNGIPADFIYHMLQDRKGDYWLMSGHGICRIRRDELVGAADGRSDRVTPVGFDTRDGMATGTTPIGWQRAAVLAQDGRLWFATFRGVTWTDPSVELKTGVAPPAYVDAAIVDGRSVDLVKRPRVPPGTAGIEFRYTGVTFSSPERMRFRHKLDGLDRGWHDAGRRQVVYYSNLAPGDYRFRVQACGADGACSENEAAVAFTIVPRFTQTWPFFGLMTLGVALGAFSAYRFRTRQLRAREADLQRRVEEALTHVKTLSGLLPICAMCKKIRTDGGEYVAVESYIREHSTAEFTHGYCPECAERLFPGFHPKGD